VKRLLLLVFGLLISQAFARELECDENSPSCQRVGEWKFNLALGYGRLDNPLNGGEDFPLVVIPNFSYYAESWYIENTEIGYTFINDEKYDVSVVSTPNKQASLFHQFHPSNLFLGIDGGPINSVYFDPERDLPPSVDTVGNRSFAVDAGLVSNFYLSQSMKLRVNWLYDISNVYKGYHVGADFTKYFSSVFFSDDTLGLGVGFDYSSSGLNDYYYGIGQKDTDYNDDFIELNGGLSHHFGGSYTRPINEKWRFNMFIRYQKLSREMYRSPLVHQSSTFDYFISAVYEF